MASKTDTEVVIGGKVLKLSGYESEEYLQKVAAYINNKINEYNRLDGFRKQSLDTQATLLQLNIADDFFKAKRQITILEAEMQAKEKEYCDLKHELVSCQIQLDNAKNYMKELQEQCDEQSRSIVRLETELKNK
ncbi:MAG: cell division protein ZapA [Lachnospiraceae bacterium]|nr:cell division protein ZapA [Lachnospiraceae bacterium]MBP5223648.1 cell division protein ZapA [Lachnospiraceae bacterium]